MLKQELAQLKLELHQTDRELQARLHQGVENSEPHDVDCPSRRTNAL
jgi:hypothetical protein